MLKDFNIDSVNRISSKRKVVVFLKSKYEYSEGPLGNVLRTSWERPESTSQGRPLNVRLGRPRDVISRRPPDGQIGSKGDVLGTLEGDVLRTSWGPIFAGWGMLQQLLASRKIFLPLTKSFLLLKCKLSNEEIKRCLRDVPISKYFPLVNK